VKTILLLFAAWCAATPALTQSSYFPIRTNAGAEGVTPFESKWYGESLQRMGEPRLPTIAQDVSAQVYRFMIFPTWGNTISVRVQRHGELYRLSARRLDGQAGYDPGKLVESKDVELNARDSTTLEGLIQNLRFFQLPTDDAVRGNDGDEWVLEGVSDGKYHIVQRWCAAEDNPKKRGLKPFLALSRFLINKSSLSERPRNKGHRLI
jgi:hypothetical protein